MKTLGLKHDRTGVTVSLEFNEFELSTLVALVEEGGKRLVASDTPQYLHQHMTAVAREFKTVLGHLELLSADG